MVDFPRFDDLFRIGRDEVLSRNARLSRDAIEREGMDGNILLAAATAMSDEVVGQLVELSAGLFLDSASDSALDRLVFDRYGLVRKDAATAYGSAQFSTVVANPSAFTIPAGTLLSASDGRQYVTTDDGLFSAGTTTGPLVAFRSVLAGADQQAKAGTITAIVSTISGAADDLAVTNPTATAGADDKETDDDLRDRARMFFTTARRGTLSAIEAGAMAVAGVRKASATEVLDALGRPARYVMLAISDAYTDQLADYSTIPPRFEAQSQVLTRSVYNGLSDVRPAGVFVQVQVAQVVMVAVQLSLAFRAGVDTDSVANLARSAVVNLVNDLAPGDSLLVSELREVVRAISGISYTGNEIVSPTGDITANPIQVLRTSPTLVACVSGVTGRPLLTSSNPDSFVEV